MVSAAEASAARTRRELSKARVSISAGIVKSAVWGAGAPVTVITVEGVDFTNLPIAGSLSLLPGMTVNVLRLPGQLIVLGSSSADIQPLQGTVSATGTGTCQVQLSYTSGTRTVLAPWLQHYTPVVGHVVMIAWASGVPVVVGRLSQSLATTLEPPYVPSVPPIGPVKGTEVFNATDSGTQLGATSWGSGKNLDASVNLTGTVGWWFYGAKIKSTMVGRVPDTMPGIFLDFNQAPYGVDLFLHTASKRGDVTTFTARTPTFHIATSGKEANWFEFPKDWAIALMANGGGIGVQPSGDNAYLNGIDLNSQSGALRIPWKLA